MFPYQGCNQAEAEQAASSSDSGAGKQKFANVIVGKHSGREDTQDRPTDFASSIFGVWLWPCMFVQFEPRWLCTRTSVCWFLAGSLPKAAPKINTEIEYMSV